MAYPLFKKDLCWTQTLQIFCGSFVLLLPFLAQNLNKIESFVKSIHSCRLKMSFLVDL